MSRTSRTGLCSSAGRSRSQGCEGSTGVSAATAVRCARNSGTGAAARSSSRTPGGESGYRADSGTEAIHSGAKFVNQTGRLAGHSAGQQARASSGCASASSLSRHDGGDTPGVSTTHASATNSFRGAQHDRRRCGGTEEHRSQRRDVPIAFEGGCAEESDRGGFAAGGKETPYSLSVDMRTSGAGVHQRSATTRERVIEVLDDALVGDREAIKALERALQDCAEKSRDGLARLERASLEQANKHERQQEAVIAALRHGDRIVADELLSKMVELNEKLGLNMQTLEDEIFAELRGVVDQVSVAGHENSAVIARCREEEFEPAGKLFEAVQKAAALHTDELGEHLDTECFAFSSCIAELRESRDLAAETSSGLVLAQETLASNVSELSNDMALISGECREVAAEIAEHTCEARYSELRAGIEGSRTARDALVVSVSDSVEAVRLEVQSDLERARCACRVLAAESADEALRDSREVFKNDLRGGLSESRAAMNEFVLSVEEQISVLRLELGSGLEKVSSTCTDAAMVTARQTVESVRDVCVEDLRAGLEDAQSARAELASSLCESFSASHLELCTELLDLRHVLWEMLVAMKTALVASEKGSVPSDLVVKSAAGQSSSELQDSTCMDLRVCLGEACLVLQAFGKNYHESSTLMREQLCGEICDLRNEFQGVASATEEQAAHQAWEKCEQPARRTEEIVAALRSELAESLCELRSQATAAALVQQVPGGIARKSAVQDEEAIASATIGRVESQTVANDLSISESRCEITADITVASCDDRGRSRVRSTPQEHIPENISTDEDPWLIARACSEDSKLSCDDVIGMVMDLPHQTSLDSLSLQDSLDLTSQFGDLSKYVTEQSTASRGAAEKSSQVRAETLPRDPATQDESALQGGNQSVRSSMLVKRLAAIEATIKNQISTHASSCDADKLCDVLERLRIIEDRLSGAGHDLPMQLSSLGAQRSEEFKVPVARSGQVVLDENAHGARVPMKQSEFLILESRIEALQTQLLPLPQAVEDARAQQDALRAEVDVVHAQVTRSCRQERPLSQQDLRESSEAAESRITAPVMRSDLRRVGKVPRRSSDLINDGSCVGESDNQTVQPADTSDAADGITQSDTGGPESNTDFAGTIGTAKLEQRLEACAKKLRKGTRSVSVAAKGESRRADRDGASFLDDGGGTALPHGKQALAAGTNGTVSRCSCNGTCHQACSVRFAELEDRIDALRDTYRRSAEQVNRQLLLLGMRTDCHQQSFSRDLTHSADAERSTDQVGIADPAQTSDTQGVDLCSLWKAVNQLTDDVLKAQGGADAAYATAASTSATIRQQSDSLARLEARVERQAELCVQQVHDGMLAEQGQIRESCERQIKHAVGDCESLVAESQRQCKSWVDGSLRKLEDLALRTRERFSALAAEVRDVSGAASGTGRSRLAETDAKELLTELVAPLRSRIDDLTQQSSAISEKANQVSDAVQKVVDQQLIDADRFSDEMESLRAHLDRLSGPVLHASVESYTNAYCEDHNSSETCMSHHSSERLALEEATSSNRASPGRASDCFSPQEQSLSRLLPLKQSRNRLVNSTPASSVMVERLGVAVDSAVAGQRNGGPDLLDRAQRRFGSPHKTLSSPPRSEPSTVSARPSSGARTRVRLAAVGTARQPSMSDDDGSALLGTD